MGEGMRSPTAADRLRHFSIVAMTYLGIGVACGGPSKVTAPTSGPGAPSDVSAMESDAAAPSSPPQKGSASPPVTLLPRTSAGLCGCALCKPVLSQDACTSDADCAPEAPCHSEACVAKAKARPLLPGMSCTAILRCDTTDANLCGCFDGRCGLRPKK